MLLKLFDIKIIYGLAFFIENALQQYINGRALLEVAREKWK
jgi:hypothetical protein